MNNKIEKIVKLIKEHDKIAFYHHVMIDGDSFTSSYALLKAIAIKYPNKDLIFVADYKEVQKRFNYLNIDKSVFKDSSDESYLAIVGDVANGARINKFEEYDKSKVRIAFDHHRNDIDFETDVFWHEPDWIASSIQATNIVEALEIDLDEESALHLLYGIITDSGRFAYSGSDPLPLEVAARLMRNISNEKMSKLYQDMSRKTLKGLKFEAWVFDKLVLEDGLGYVIITKKDQDGLGIDANRAARVNLIANIEGEKVWMFFIEYPEFIRVEFRSNGIAVNEIAKHFGGGGHIKAAGVKLESLKQIQSVINYTKEVIKNS